LRYILKPKIMDAIFSFLAERYPEIGILIIACVIVSLATRFYISVQSTRKKVDALPCDEHKRNFVSIGSRLDKIDLKFDYIDEKKDKAKILELALRHSPLRLTTKGTDFLTNSGGKKLLDENIDFFISKLEATEPMTPYDVENNASNVVLECSSLPMFNPVKNFLYFTPKLGLNEKDEEPTMFTVAYVMGLYLRDIYIEKHPEIMPEMEPA